MAEFGKNKSIAQLLLESASQDLADWLDELNPYAVEARYGTIDPEGLDRGHAVGVTAQVMAWANAQVAVTSQS